ncbi:MAG: hypothetical protein ACYDBJ_11095 [Aggregatilineales bacterium]
MQRGATTSLALMYPDVLGLLSGGARLTVETVQCALGVYPHGAAIGQPFEALVVLQNLCDQSVPVKVTIKLPRRTATGERLSLFAPRETLDVPLPPGEVGLLHFPILAQLPTPVGMDYPISVRVEAHHPRNAKWIRDPFGGRAPGALPISKHRRLILQREVGFSAHADESTPANTLHATFDVLPGQVTAKYDLTARYEPLWIAQHLIQDQEAYAAIEVQTRSIANMLTRTRVYEPLRAETERQFTAADSPLYPGETLEIAKLLTYTMNDGLETDSALPLTETHWFQRLTLCLADEALLNDTDRLITRLYTALAHDAVLVGYTMLAQSLKGEDVERNAKPRRPAQTPPFGLPAEHRSQAEKLMQLLDRQQPITPEAIYMPLIVAGLMQHVQVKGTVNGQMENLWTSLAQIREAWRLRQASGTLRSPITTQMMPELLKTAEDFLVSTRVPRA